MKLRKELIILILIPLLFLQPLSSESIHNLYCMKKSYNYYKKFFLEKSGQIIEVKNLKITKSSAQAYMLLKSYLSEDKKTFDKVYEWTKNHLKGESGLFYESAEKVSKDQTIILSYNQPPEANTEIALSLILAYEKWNNSYYLKEAKPIIKAIREKFIKKFKEEEVFGFQIPQLIQMKSS